MKKELNGGLILRSLSEGIAQDAANLPIFYRDIFKAEGDPHAENLLPWTQDLIDRHPVVTEDDIWVIVDPAADDKIVSAVLLIPQVWRCGDVMLPVGQVELVGTDKDYRRRGLIRQLFEVAHARSAELGHVLQFIGGIPYFYRQFGYVMAMDVGMRHSVALFSVPALKEGVQSQFTLRFATYDDIPALMAFDAYYARHFTNFVSYYDETMWRYQIDGKRPDATTNRDVMMIVNTSGDAVGYLMLHKPLINGGHGLACIAYVVGPNTSYLATYEDVMRGMNAFVKETYPENDVLMVSFAGGLTEAFDALAIETGHALGPNMGLHTAPSIPYPWYLRVPDYVALLKVMTPVLEDRLDGSAANQYTGDLNMGLYKPYYLRITFENGRVTHIGQHELGDGAPFHVQFPDLTFLYLLSGYRTIDELRQLYPDLQIARNGRVLLEALFPKQRSTITMTG
ncbi:GNAT family N-acetyltransferase [Phototrophicus methaneseepsis]|uniref:GNAT family N-acetyltransferase n=1 Tax=Phototrophicus methaneseepsis TaxID=2710758 RepID=A0A7S8E7I7_9CHLR|nr:GNAT family N-acetyltransferase [Phototrophicus methaneseepsis]QPC81785.1 GNAT family N-acetyltransferase [Phototrophicus methaneseepsis]